MMRRLGRPFTRGPSREFPDMAANVWQHRVTNHDWDVHGNTHAIRYNQYQLEVVTCALTRITQ